MNSKESQNYGLDGQDARNSETEQNRQSESLNSESINLYRHIYRKTTAAICLLEVVREGEYFYVDFNPRCEAWLGVATEELKGKSPQEIFTEKDVDEVLQAYDSCVRSQKSITYEKCFSLGSKRTCWMTTINPEVDSNGKVIQLISTSVDISQQQQTQLRSALRKLQQALQSDELVRSITQAIRDSLDEKQVLQTATRSLTVGLEIDCSQIELYKYDRTITEVICEYPIVLPDEQGIHRQVKDFPELYKSLLAKKPLLFVDLLPTIGYRQQQATRLVCPIFDDRGILGNIWLMRPKEGVFEPEEIKLVQQIADQCAIAIRQARLYKTEQIQVKELEKLNVIKDDFLKTISHELRTPMSRLRLAISTLENLLEVEFGGHNSARIEKVMEIFHSSFKKQNQLVDDLLTLCYVDVTSKPNQWEAIDLQTWIPQIVKTFPALNQQQIQLDLTADLPPLHSDLKMLKRVVNELLSNACKYTPAKEKIIICTEKNANQIFLKVINTGVEIPVEEQEKIFDKFYRIPNNDPWQHGGTGIGLALVKKLVELLEGGITVSSENRTTTFTIAFYLN